MKDVQGQLAIEPNLLETPSRQIAFVTVVQHPELLADTWTPEAVPVLPEPTEEEEARVGAFALRGYIAGQRRAENRLVIDTWALPSRDYTILPKGLSSLSSHARAKTHSARRNKPVAGDTASQAADRASIHILEDRVPKLEAYRDGLAAELIAMSAIKREIRKPWMAHKSVRTWQSLIDTVVQKSFFGMLEAASLQHDWDTETVMPVLKRAMADKLFGPERDLIAERREYWLDMLYIGTQYAQARKTIASRNITLINSRIKRAGLGAQAAMESSIVRGPAVLPHPEGAAEAEALVPPDAKPQWEEQQLRVTTEPEA